MKPFPIPSFGGAPNIKKNPKAIRLLLKGCTNRPFFHISVQDKRLAKNDPVIEQIGTYDPLPNSRNEKLVGINYTRLEHWIREGATVTVPVLKLLGLSGYFPIHPETFGEAWINRKKVIKALEELKSTAASLSTTEQSKPSESDMSTST